MAKIKDVTMSFPPSGSPDVVGYKLYVAEAPAEVTYESDSFDLGAETVVVLNTLPGMLDRDGVFNIGVVAVDDAGNESSMSLLNDVPLDFQAPEAPGPITIERS